MKDKIIKNRQILRADCYYKLVDDNYKDWKSDQQKKLPPPPLQKPYPENAKLYDLVPIKDINIGKTALIEIIQKRKSHRKYTDESLTLEELSFLLWSTQGIHLDNIHPEKVWAKRTVPSGGARHPFETYLLIKRVESIPTAIYRYLPLEHKLCHVSNTDNLTDSDIDSMFYNQKFVKEAAAIFFWTTIPYRTEWRYGIFGHKDIAIEAGHVCQNLYLSCNSINAGTCALAAYNQEETDKILEINGIDELTIYVSPVGKVE